MGSRILSVLFPAGSWEGVFQYLSKTDLLPKAGGPPNTFGQMLLVGCAWAFVLVCLWPLARIIKVMRAYRAGTRPVFRDPKGPRENILFGVRFLSAVAFAGTALAWYFARVCAANMTAGMDRYLAFADTFFLLALGFAALAGAAHALLVPVRRRRLAAETLDREENAAKERSAEDAMRRAERKVLEGGGLDDLRTLSRCQVERAEKLRLEEDLDGAAELYQRAIANDDCIVRNANDPAYLPVAADHCLALGEVLMQMKGDPLKVWEKALQLALRLQQTDPKAGGERAAAANFAVGCALWSRRRFAESMIRCANAAGEAGVDGLSCPAGMAPEEQRRMLRCFAALTQAAMPEGWDRRLAALDADVWEGTIPGADTPPEDLALLAEYLHALGSALLDVQNARGAAAECKNSARVWAELMRRRHSEDAEKRLGETLAHLADIYESMGQKEEAAFWRKQAARHPDAGGA